MYRSGQVLWDDTLAEAVIFIQGKGRSVEVVSCAVVETSETAAKDVYPLWKKNNSVFLGKYALPNFHKILDYKEEKWDELSDYLVEINKKIKVGKDDNDELPYHLKIG